jgi:broad specificity polyphosphatase/5'/3'-nucleotidase SurE
MPRSCSTCAANVEGKRYPCTQCFNVNVNVNHEQPWHYQQQQHLQHQYQQPWQQQQQQQQQQQPWQQQPWQQHQQQNDPRVRIAMINMLPFL